jgi:phenylalanyl-tRNA synthetase alpha subunit
MDAGGIPGAFFEVDGGVELRFRASHFPFTEPSAEVDIRCSWEGGVLRSARATTGWRSSARA